MSHDRIVFTFSANVAVPVHLWPVVIAFLQSLTSGHFDWQKPGAAQATLRHLSLTALQKANASESNLPVDPLVEEAAAFLRRVGEKLAAQKIEEFAPADLDRCVIVFERMPE